MLTDEQISDIDSISEYDADEDCKLVAQGYFDLLCAQAREANKLRAENERLTLTDTLTAHRLIIDARTAELASAQQRLSLFETQMAEMGKVCAAADAYTDHGQETNSPEDVRAFYVLSDASEHYQDWLASHPHVNHVGTTTVQPGKSEGQS